MIFFGHIGITLLFAYLAFHVLREKIDCRFLIVGAMLPDLIDKPIGNYLFYETFQNGRIFAHTLLFLASLTLIAYYAEKKYRFLGVSMLALGAIAHLAEDQMWRWTSTLLWPLLGLEFPAYDMPDYAGYLLYVLTHEPDAYLPEIAGILIIAWFVWRFELYRPERIKVFIRTGRLPSKGQLITGQTPAAIE